MNTFYIISAYAIFMDELAYEVYLSNKAWFDHIFGYINYRLSTRPNMAVYLYLDNGLTKLDLAPAHVNQTCTMLTLVFSALNLKSENIYVKNNGRLYEAISIDCMTLFKDGKFETIDPSKLKTSSKSIVRKSVPIWVSED